MTRPLAALAFSGGIDSTVLAALYQHHGYDLLLLSFDYGQRHRHRELRAASAVAAWYDAEHHVIDLSTLGRLLPGSALIDPTVDVPAGHYTADTMRATVVPNRNAIMGTILAGVASARRAELVALGIHAGDHHIYPDCRPAFLTDLARLTRTALDGHHTPRVEAPFVHLSKTDIVRRGHDHDAPLALTWSCYRGGELHCGTCGTCVERREAFTLARVPDPTDYEVTA